MVFSYIHDKFICKKAFFSLVPIEIITDFMEECNIFEACQCPEKVENILHIITTG